MFDVLSLENSLSAYLVNPAISFIAPSILLKAPIRSRAFSRKGRASGFLCLDRASLAQATT